MFNFLSIFSIVLLTYLLIAHGTSNINLKAEPDIACYTTVAPLWMPIFKRYKAHQKFLRSFMMKFCALFPLQLEIFMIEYIKSHCNSMLAGGVGMYPLENTF